MPYTRITSLVPEGEHFDESAVGEGVWLSTGHLNSIESTLEQSTVALETAEANLTANIEQGTVIVQERNEAQAALQTANATIATQTTRIAELEAQVAQLGKAPSGSGSTLVVEKDETVEEKPVASYASDNNPANAWVDKQLRKKTA